MAITLFGTASNPADNGAANEPVTLDITPPASMASGMLAIIAGNMRSATSGLITQSALGGQTWPVIRAGTNAGNNSVNLALWFAEFNGTWSANPSLAFASATGTIPTTAILPVFQGATSWAIDVAVSSAAFSAASTVTRTGLTTAHNEAIVIAAFTNGTNNTWGGISGAGWTQLGTQWRNTAGSGIVVAFAYQYVPTSGTATGNVSLTQSGTPVAGQSLIFSIFGTPAAANRPVKRAGSWGGYAGRSGGFAARKSGLMVPAHMSNDNAERLAA
jgi:hypothetical protein